jgi:hypothetical protein
VLTKKYLGGVGPLQLIQRAVGLLGFNSLGRLLKFAMGGISGPAWKAQVERHIWGLISVWSEFSDGYDLKF